MTPEIPKEQIERLQPIVDAVLADLRRRTELLDSQVDLALAYRPESEARS